MPPSPKRPLTVTDFARLGGYARAARLTRDQRRQQAAHAAQVRWRSPRALKKKVTAS
jgi:hypothetical protein